MDKAEKAEKMDKAEKADKVDKAVALAVAELEAVAFAVVTEMEEIEETFCVDVSVNSRKIDHPWQLLGGKSHMYVLSGKLGNYNALQSYAY